jgi:hypothetical protein
VQGGCPRVGARGSGPAGRQVGPAGLRSDGRYITADESGLKTSSSTHPAATNADSRSCWCARASSRDANERDLVTPSRPITSNCTHPLYWCRLMTMCSDARSKTVVLGGMRTVSALLLAGNSRGVASTCMQCRATICSRTRQRQRTSHRISSYPCSSRRRSRAGSGSCASVVRRRLAMRGVGLGNACGQLPRRSDIANSSPHPSQRRYTNRAVIVATRTDSAWHLRHARSLMTVLCRSSADTVL